LTKFKEGKSIVLMFFEDVLKLLYRLGVRPVNDAMAHVAVEVTADMDPEGMGAHMGAGLHVVEAVPFDQSVLLDAINNGNNSVMTHSIKLNDKTMLHVDTVFKKEGDARKKAIKGLKAEMKAQKEDTKLQHEDMKLQNADLQKRLVLLKQGAACNKRPRNAPNDGPKQANNITWNKLKDSFGWMKMVKGVSSSSKGFSSAEEAKLDMQRFYTVAVEGSMPLCGSLVSSLRSLK